MSIDFKQAWCFQTVYLNLMSDKICFSSVSTVDVIFCLQNFTWTHLELLSYCHLFKYITYIFTIDNPEFEKHIPDIYPAELQLNKANTSDKETSFLDLNIKVIDSDIHTSVYDKRDDFGFHIVNFQWLSGDVPRLPSYGIYISQMVR